MSLEGKSAEEIAALAELAQSLASNPATRLGFLNLTKKANPSTHIPEIDIPNQINSHFAAGLARLGALEKENENMKIQQSIMAKRQLLLDSGVAKKDIPDIEKLMLEKKIPDHQTAAEFFKMQQKAAVPTPASTLTGSRTNHMPAMDLKPFNGNINDWARNAASKAIDEIKAGQIKLA